MNMITTIFSHIADGLILVLLVGLAIFIHELGHFLVALRCGFVVETFSIGFGKAIWKKEHRGITYKIGWIPLGGYVALPQLDPTGMAMVQGKSADGKETEAKPLPPVSPWAKILVALAGAGGNLVLALVIAIIIAVVPSAGTGRQGPLLITVTENSPAHAAGLRTGQEIFAVNGTPVKTWYDFHVECALPEATDVKITIRANGQDSNVAVGLKTGEMGLRQIEGMQESTDSLIMAIQPGSPAEAAGLKAGDKILSMNTVPTHTYAEFRDQVRKSGGIGPVPIVVEREGKVLALSVEPMVDPETKVAVVGARFDNLVPAWMEHKGVWAQLKGDAMMIIRVLQGLTAKDEYKQVLDNLGGLPSIVVSLWIAIQDSIFNAFGFLRFLCVNLAIINLLPIPLLDGGHILFFLWEGITKRRVHPKVANALVNTFGSLLIAGLLYINIRDVIRLPKFFKLVREKPAVEAPASTNAAATTP